ncbi:MAG: hypothetical protein HAW64_01065 [Alphaproteobacteria bacterium]|nr:hypothetical protein [Alphaproteobacteria bacterium]
MERLTTAATRIGALGEAVGQAHIEAAHLRGEISDLKRKNKQLQSDNKRAASRVEKALAKLDSLLGVQ